MQLTCDCKSCHSDSNLTDTTRCFQPSKCDYRYFHCVKSLQDKTNHLTQLECDYRNCHCGSSLTDTTRYCPRSVCGYRYFHCG